MFFDLPRHPDTYYFEVNVIPIDGKCDFDNSGNLSLEEINNSKTFNEINIANDQIIESEPFNINLLEGRFKILYYFQNSDGLSLRHLHNYINFIFKSYLNDEQVTDTEFLEFRGHYTYLWNLDKKNNKSHKYRLIRNPSCCVIDSRAA
jgi:hypothetical protein